MSVKLFDSERKVMEVLWKYGELTAGQLAEVLKRETGWNRNTTYTVIKKCIAKGAIERLEPHFLCRPIIGLEQVRQEETDKLIDKWFGGSSAQFFSAFLDSHPVSNEEAAQLKRLVEKLK